MYSPANTHQAPPASMPTDHEPRSVRECLAGATRLSALVAAVGRLRQVGDALHAALDAPLRDHLRVASHERGRLVLIADSAAWCTRARYSAETVATSLRAGGLDVREVRIVTRPPRALPTARPRTANPISPGTATLLRAIAAQTTDDALRSSLLRLAARAEQP